MKYANFCDTGRCNINIGDYLQFIATEYLLSRLNVPFEDIVHLGFKDLENYDGEEVVFPFCYSVIDFVKNGRIAISNKIKPVFFAITLSTIDHFMDVDEFLSDEYNVEYLQKNGPIGCRDEITYNLMTRHGIPAYINGCMTAILPKSTKTGGDKILYVDAPLSLLSYIPEDMRSNCEFSTQQYHFSEADIRDYKKIFRFVSEKYEYYKTTAKVAITSRLHVALPLSAFGIPVILAKESADGRFSFIERYLPIYNKENFSNIDWKPGVPKFENFKELLINHAIKRILDYENHSLNDIEKHLTEQFKSRKVLCNYDNSYLVTHTNSEKFDEYAALYWKKDKPIRYAFWGVSENNFDFWTEHIHSKYPNAKLTAVFDSFRDGNFRSFQCFNPEMITEYEGESIIVCSVGAAQAAPKLFRRLGIDRKRFCIASDCFISSDNI